MSKPVWSNDMTYLRGFAILAVIFTHVADSVNGFTAWIPKLHLGTFFLLGVVRGYPVFAFVSGFVLERAWARSEKSAKKFYLKRLDSVLLPYLFFSAVYFIYSGRYHGQMPMEVLGDFAMSMWRSDTSSQLWFIFNLTQLYLMFPLLATLFDWAGRRNKTGYLLAGVFLVHMLWMGCASVLRVKFADADMIVRQVIFSNLFSFCLGIAVSRGGEAAQAKLRAFSIPLLLAVLGLLGYAIAVISLEGVRRYGHFYNIEFPFPTLLFWLRSLVFPLYIVLLWRLTQYLGRFPSWVAATLSHLGKYSFGIFLIHMIILDELKKGLAYVGVDYKSIFFYPALLFATAFMSWAAAWMMSRLPWSCYLIGKTEGRGIVAAAPSVARP